MLNPIPHPAASNLLTYASNLHGVVEEGLIAF